MLITPFANTLGATECLETSLDLKRVCKEIKAKGCPCSVDISHDAGR